MVDASLLDWLLDTDPALRWQVMRDLTDAPADEVSAERARVAGEGWGAEILAAHDDVASGQQGQTYMYCVELFRRSGPMTPITR